MSDLLQAARDALAIEISGLHAVSDSLDEKFLAAVEIIHQAKGKCIVSGMGKSGHVGRKIAATLASTGCPAFFVHPGEASHGDLGMIGPDDVLLVLSNSGETAELKDLIYYASRFDIPLIAMVRRKSSILVDAATVPLVLPEIPEATPGGAPTTSTTMMMALGDAIAVALMELKGFSKDDFGVYHPGGKLGSAFVRVKDIMHDGEALPLVSSDMLMREVLLIMTSKRFGCAAVVDDSQKLLGIITDGDLRRHLDESLLERKAADVMTVNPRVARPESLVTQALGLMNEKAITCLFVVDTDETVRGIIHMHDCLRTGVA